MADEDTQQEHAVPIPAASGQPGMLRDRYSVLAAQPIVNLSTSCADAYVCEDRKESSRKLFALVCKPGIPPRLGLMRGTRGLSYVGLMQLVEWGPMSWPLAGRQCMTLIYERPLGQRVMPSLRDEIPRFGEQDITRRVVEPMLAVLKELSGRGAAHRAIRPTNFFYMDERGDRIALGDGASAPAAMDQPAICEPIESAMCTPIARGNGGIEDDMYALGATIAMFMIGKAFAHHTHDEAILRNKLEYGSYATIVGENRMPLAMIELLRGLLCDDAKQRWTPEIMEFWVQGRRLTPIQAKQEKRAGRAFPFMGHDYLTGRELASAFAHNWEAALAIVLEGKLELWIRRAVEDKEKAEAVADQVRMALITTTEKESAEHVMLARILMMLDPLAPIRYRGFGAMPDGIGVALAVLMANSSDTKLLIEMIKRDVPKSYYEVQGARRDDPLIENNFREIRNQLTQMGLGFGLERALYELNDSLPLQSPLVGEAYVVEIKDLLPGLNGYGAVHGTAKQWPCDRHIAAFIGARARSDVDRNLATLNGGDKTKALMALLNMMAVFQYRLGPESMPGLASWVAKLAGTLLENYHSRDKRKEFETVLPKLVKRGSVVEIYQLIDDPNSKEKDVNDFAWAQAQYWAAEEAIKHILNQEEDVMSGSDKVGKQLAAVTGILIALLSITIVVIMKVW
jgi:hypothetical protein